MGTNVDLPSMTALWQIASDFKYVWKLRVWKVQPHLQGVNELT